MMEWIQNTHCRLISEEKWPINHTHGQTTSYMLTCINIPNVLWSWYPVIVVSFSSSPGSHCLELCKILWDLMWFKMVMTNKKQAVKKKPLGTSSSRVSHDVPGWEQVLLTIWAKEIRSQIQNSMQNSLILVWERGNTRKSYFSVYIQEKNAKKIQWSEGSSGQK